jgi:hypothetical protein
MVGRRVATRLYRPWYCATHNRIGIRSLMFIVRGGRIAVVLRGCGIGCQPPARFIAKIDRCAR